MEGAVIPEAREGVGLRLQLETRPDVGVVEREGGRVAEPDREPELFLRELLQADAVDVEGTLDPPACDQRDGDQRLRIGRRALDEPHPRVEVGAVRQHGLPVLDGPAGDPLSEARTARRRAPRPHSRRGQARRGAREWSRPLRRRRDRRAGSARRPCRRSARAGRRETAPRARRGTRRRDGGTTRRARADAASSSPSPLPGAAFAAGVSVGGVTIHPTHRRCGAAA